MVPATSTPPYTIDDEQIADCRSCGEKPGLVYTMLNYPTGRPVRMFECSCGERTWED